jgi:hypothetical protein
MGFYRAVAADPILAELFLIHAATSRVDEGRSAARAGAERFVPLFRLGRAQAETEGRRSVPSLAEEFFSRAVVSLAARRVREPSVATLPEESRNAAALVVGCYVGPGAADELLRAPTAR